MKIDGKKIANEALKQLALTYSDKPKPSLAIILIGNDSASSVYINQKKRVGERIGINVTVKNFRDTASENQIIKQIADYNSNRSISGIIVQLPLPKNLNANKIISTIDPKKEVDGFLPNSPHTPPVACAVLKALEIAFNDNMLGRTSRTRRPIHPQVNSRGLLGTGIKPALRQKSTVIIGRGKTGGMPIIKTFNKLKIPYTLIHAKTPNPDRIIKKADIIISCVGKPNIITPANIKRGVILIGVGIHKDNTGNMAGDYDEKKIKGIASFYTPTPGGVGPLTVACLMKNVSQ
jgi:methylenetetrahydrofolate dehydrogenase (NADP+) / methenyltetrahydrofolate cyclohydrolase